jgi:hypothetical protein
VEDTNQWHYPGSQFNGPGTHIVNKIRSNILPTTKGDYLAMLHDIEYLLTAGQPELQWAADKRAIQQQNFNLEGLALTLGLTSRQILGLEFNNPLKNKTPYETNSLGKELLFKVLFSKNYVDLASFFKIDTSAYHTLLN